MNKIKITHKYAVPLILLFALFVSIASLFMMNIVTVSAAAPGCYQVVGSTTQETTTTTYTSVTCPNEDLARGVRSGQCYVAQVNVSSRGAVVGTYNNRSCDSFEVGQNTTARPEETFTPAEVDCEEGELTRKNCGIINYLVITINFLSAVAVMAIVASVMIAGYQYMTARDNPGQVQAAKQRIIWAMVALGLFIFGYALLNFLVPGGVL